MEAEPVPSASTWRFEHWQRQTFVVAWLTYASFYLCRVNLAVAMPSLQSTLGWDVRTAGLIGSVFLWAYAIGQLINGTLAQKVDARWFVGLGMAASAACNALFGASSGPGLMALLWGINGWAQSMGWGAIMKTISAWFDPSQRGKITAFFSPCFVLGHLLAWAAGGWVASRWGWRWAFWLPAGILSVMAVTWLTAIRPTPADAGFGPPGQAQRRNSTKAGIREILSALLAHPRVRWAALTCIFASMIKDGLNLWAPTFLVDALGMEVSSAAWAASVLPLFGLAGSLLAGWLSDRFFRSHEAPGIIALSLVIGGAMIGFVLLPHRGPQAIAIALLGISGMAVYGINALLLTSFPLSFSHQGSVSAVAGFLDFAAYVGGGISALTVGQLLGRWSWPAVFGYWLAATLVAAVSATRLKAS